MNTRVIGSFEEDVAISYLKENGFEILEQNFKCKIGEIDVIAKKDNAIRFIEVKYRKGNVAGGAHYTISKSKLIKISKIASFYIMTHPNGNSSYSIDAIIIENDCIEYLENIFGGM